MEMKIIVPCHRTFNIQILEKMYSMLMMNRRIFLEYYKNLLTICLEKFNFTIFMSGFDDNSVNTEL